MAHSLDTTSPTTATEPEEERLPSFLERLGEAGASAASLEPSHPGLRRALAIGLPMLVIASVGIGVAAEWSALSTVYGRFEPRWLAASLVAFLSFQAFHAEAWRLLLGSLGGRLDPLQARAIYNASLLGRYVPTSALMVIARVALTKRRGVERRVCLASIVYEGALSLTAALWIGAYFVIELEQLSAQPLRYAAVGLPAAALVALHPRVFHPMANALLRRLGREPLPLSLPASTVLTVGAIYVVSFLVAGIGVYCLTRALYPLTPGAELAAVASYAVGFTFSVLAFVLPAGLGAREAGLAAALAPALPPTIAVTVALVVRVIQTGVEIIYALVSSALAGRALRRARRATVEPGR